MSSLTFNQSVVKPVAAGLTIYAIDQFYFKQSNQMSSIYFAGAVGAGVGMGSVLGTMVPDFGLGNIGSGKQTSSRILEIGLGVSSSYLLNAYILRNEYNRDTMYQKLGAIVIADIVSEYAADYVANRQLSFFN